jgi:succinoglycan biosynthesis protein ExoA
LIVFEIFTVSIDSSSVLISVVVPCRNEARSIEACVTSILGQQAPAGEFEIIVVDAMSEDGTRDILGRLQKRDSRLRVIDNPQRVTPAGMNAGILQSRGRYIAIMGAHNRYANDYLCRSIEILQRTGADNVGGAMVAEGRTRIQRAIAAVHHNPFSSGNARWHSLNYEGWADTVFGGVYRRDVFDRIGLFDEELARNQDDELNLRLIRAGGRIYQSPHIKSWYFPRRSLRELFEQYLQYGYWKVRVIQKHKIPASIRHLIPGVFVTSMLFLPLLALTGSSTAMWMWLAILAIYAISVLAASIGAAASSDWTLLPLFPVVFPCYHFAYGFGFMRGVLDFLILKRHPAPAYFLLSRNLHPGSLKKNRRKAAGRRSDKRAI